MTQIRAGRKFAALAIGIVATIVGATVYLLGWLDPLNGYNLDVHFRHFNTIKADSRVVLIDIDDTTLSAMPNWPWPRRVFADLTRTLNELGPRAILLDVLFTDPSEPRVEHAGFGKHYDVDQAQLEAGERAFDQPIFDDRELSDSLARAGNVYLPSTARLALHHESAAEGDKMREARPTEPALGLTWEQYFRTAHPNEPIDAQTPKREELLLEFRRSSAERVVRLRLPETPSNVVGRIPVAFDFVPPLEKFARMTKGVGLASFHRESAQAVVHGLPLLVDAGGVLLPQLGLLVALDVLGIPAAQIAMNAGRWQFGQGDLIRTVPVTSEGASLVNWCRSKTNSVKKSFIHVPADLLLEITQNRRAIEDNGKRLGIAVAGLVKARHSDTSAAYDDYARLVNERLELFRAENSEATRLNAVNESIKRIEVEAVAWVQRAWSLWRDATPRNDQEKTERDEIKRLYDRFGEGQYAALLARANAKMVERNKQLMNDLRPQVKDKICLVGYTATAMADMVPTPVDPAMPGVMVHANVINMFLQDRFAAEASRNVGLAILLLASLATTLTSSLRGTRFSVLSLFVIAAAILGLGAGLFWLRTYHIPSMVAVAIVILVWASVTVYRQATEERARRAFQRALAQYTSPAVAARIAERTKADDLAPQKAVVTCFFSDLAAFTRLSEQLGPVATRRLLDPYLSGVSEALIHHRAMVNKFMGDGIFAFFNAPILPCPKHAMAACESAVASLAAVARSNDQRQRSGETGLLSVRIGLTTGEAFVGDYGSALKLDYTCIGDTANLGSRLERANKVLGTSILVDDATRMAAGEGFAFRSLGLIEVAGKAATVAVHELVGLVNGVDEPTRRYIALFERAIHDYQHCRWDSCLATLTECRRLRPTDRAASVYEQAVAKQRGSSNMSGWNGAIAVGHP